VAERGVAYDLSGVRLLFLVTEDWYFCSHRLPVARAAREAGAEVIVATRVDRHGEAITREGFRLVRLRWQRRSKNLLSEAAALGAITRLYRRARPHIVHHVAVKPTVYGGIAAMLAGRPRQVAAIAGLGYLSVSRQWRARLLGPVVRAALRSVLDRPEARVIVQNPDDETAMIDGAFADASRVRVIRGSGVDAERFAPADSPPPAPVTVVLAGRMLRSKGVGEAVEAARILRERGVALRMVLAGEPDPENPESIGRSRLQRWAREGVVEWRGHVDDMAALWRSAHVGLLPSYREGLPKTLLEAAACGLPLVASDVPGCREIVHEGENGFLVPAREAAPLADALERLAGDAELRAHMGKCSRELVERHFTEATVTAATLSVYAELLEDVQ
jgi:glycosyltransferase involved in cell wall biosynthesis